jgi:hypothetical protein
MDISLASQLMFSFNLENDLGAFLLTAMQDMNHDYAFRA